MLLFMVPPFSGELHGVWSSLIHEPSVARPLSLFFLVPDEEYEALEVFHGADLSGGLARGGGCLCTDEPSHRLLGRRHPRCRSPLQPHHCHRCISSGHHWRSARSSKTGADPLDPSVGGPLLRPLNVRPLLWQLHGLDVPFHVLTGPSMRWVVRRAVSQQALSVLEVQRWSMLIAPELAFLPRWPLVLLGRGC